MLRTLKALFEDKLSALAGSADEGHALPLAVAALLFEIARADHTVEAPERAAICRAVSRLCAVPAEELEALVRDADQAVDAAVSLFEFTSVVNDHFEHAQKVELVRLLWEVAHADGKIDHYEEYYVRRIADLLHVSQRDLIRTKHGA